MILNEDIFNDIEINDEVLTDDEPVEEPAKEYNEKTSKELLEHKMSESEMILMFYIDIYYFHKPFDIWHRIERIMKRLKYMFDIYNINLSEPFITYGGIGSINILKDKKIPDNYTIIQHEGCNLYFPERKLRIYEPDEIITKTNWDYDLFVFLDKKLPVFKTARSAYNFLIGLDKCLWKDVTDPKDERFRDCDFYYINDDPEIIKRNSFSTSYKDVPEIIHSQSYSSDPYVNNPGDDIYDSLLNIVPEELAELLEKKRELPKFANKILTKDDVKKIVKLVDQ